MCVLCNQSIWTNSHGTLELVIMLSSSYWKITIHPFKFVLSNNFEWNHLNRTQKTQRYEFRTLNINNRMRKYVRNFDVWKCFDASKLESILSIVIQLITTFHQTKCIACHSYSYNPDIHKYTFMMLRFLLGIEHQAFLLTPI